MNYTKKVCSFTGYRTKKLNESLSRGSLNITDLSDILEYEMKLMLDRGFETFQCGMASGADLLFAQAALKLKREYPPVRFVAVIPCAEHDKGWNPADRLVCREAAEKADDVVMVSATRYYDGCMAKRNRYLIDNCDELLAVYDGRPGGTMQTVNFAKEKGIRVTVIDPSKDVKITLREQYKNPLQPE